MNEFFLSIMRVRGVIQKFVDKHCKIKNSVRIQLKFYKVIELFYGIVHTKFQTNTSEGYKITTDIVT